MGTNAGSASSLPRRTREPAGTVWFTEQLSSAWLGLCVMYKRRHVSISLLFSLTAPLGSAMILHRTHGGKLDNQEKRGCWVQRSKEEQGVFISIDWAEPGSHVKDLSAIGAASFSPSPAQPVWGIPCRQHRKRKNKGEERRKEILGALGRLRRMPGGGGAAAAAQSHRSCR